MKKILLTLLCLPMVSTSQNIGDLYQGGIIFYVDNSGTTQKGLIIDTSYLASTYPWSIQDSLISDWGPNLHYCNGTEYELIGEGEQNTSSFEQDHPNDNYAANLCSQSYSGGFTDWFLPSIDELTEILNTVGLPPSEIYWSSSEQNSDEAKGLVTSSGLESIFTKGGFGLKTRAIRSF